VPAGGCLALALLDLLALPDEVASVAAIDPARAGAAVTMAEGGWPLELVTRIVRRRRNTQQVTRVAEEALRRRQRRRSHSLPLRAERAGLAFFCRDASTSTNTMRMAGA
jgi:hypothetical protein